MPANGSVIANNKAKGFAFQREIREKLVESFPELELDDIKSTSSGSNGEDILLSPLARRTLGGIQIECKRKKSFQLLYNMMEQAKTHGRHIPVVILRQDRSEPLITFYLNDYIELIRNHKL